MPVQAGLMNEFTFSLFLELHDCYNNNHLCVKKATNLRSSNTYLKIYLI